jgi:osmoprotectant transport system ATP-binding protein
LQLPKETANAYPAALSGGQQQRVGLARALAAKPGILLMDEPFGALDPVTRISIRKELKSLDELNKKTIVLVTHDVQEAFELGDRIGVMDKGRMVQIGSPAELLFHPVNDFVKTFFNDQRLQLELHAIRLYEVWQQFPVSGQMDSTLQHTGSLWEAMTQITETDRNITVKNEETGEIREVGFSGIQQAISSIRQKA